MVEASLAYQGIDLRDLYMPGGGISRMTWRRLHVLIRALPYDAPLWAELRDAAEKHQQEATVTHMKSRADYYKRKAMEAEEAS